MSSTRRLGLGDHLPHLLLMVAATELAVYRLAVPGLKPTSPVESPPVWHTALSYVGLFLSYFGSVLALAMIVRQLLRFARGMHPYWKPIGYALVVSGAAFVTYAARSLLIEPSEGDTFLLELFFSTTLLLLIAAQLRPGGDLAVKVGLFLVAAPLLVHFCRDAGVRWVVGEEALVTGLAERIAAYGQWSMVLGALLSPYCFAPRPFIESAGRLAPLAIGTFVGVVGALVMRKSAEVGLKIASDGLGVDLGAGAPASQIALYLIALASITWTLVACFIARSPARRRIGVGLGLVAAAGYGFDWPLQYLAGLVGFLTMSGAVREVVGQERSGHAGVARFRTPAIAAKAWQAYVVALVEALRARGFRAEAAGTEEPERESDETNATAAGGRREDGGRWRTQVFVTGAVQVPLRLLVERKGGAVRFIEVVCGSDPRAGGEQPAWTLEARQERRLGTGAHPPPPETAAPLARSGDSEFDRRFRMRDSGGHGARLFDEGLRARGTALLDGWLAFWPGRALIYHVLPGHGAPLDNPIPISQLAFRDVIWEGAVDRLVTVLDFLSQLAARGLEAETAGKGAPGEVGASPGRAPATAAGDRSDAGAAAQPETDPGAKASPDSTEDPESRRG